MNAVAQSTDLRRPLLWSLAVHTGIIVAIGLSTLNTPITPPEPKVMIIQLQQHAKMLAPNQSTPTPSTPIKPVIASTQQLPLAKTIISSAQSVNAITSQTSIAPAITPSNRSANDSTNTQQQEVIASEPVKTNQSIAPTNSVAVLAKEEAPQFDAAYLQNPKPNYPLFAKKRNQQGTVLLRVQVSADGKPDSITIAESSGIKALDEAAQEAVKQWRFVPAHRGEMAVSASVIVPITFKLS